MRCAYLIPTANPPLASACLAAWRAMGWDTFAVVEGDAVVENATGVFRQPEYPGWGDSFNRMARELAGQYDWLATGGDDCFPDPKNDATFIGGELSAHFGGTMGVCQATGDGWAWDKRGGADPICFAPFIGAEFARRWNGGRGAFWPGYFQWFADNELRSTAEEWGLLWVRPDWTVDHRHVAKRGKPTPAYNVIKQPRWQADHDLFYARKAAGFPDHAPVP
jgi:hypothetical protein